MIVVEHESAGTTGRAMALFARRVQCELGLVGEVNIRIASNRDLQDLNRRFRKKNKPTDVLSFPSEMPGVDGDIAISGDIAAQNAAKLGHSLPTELKILILHGLLHLAGYDHESDRGKMAAREAELREQLGLPTGLIERTHSAKRKSGASLSGPARKALVLSRGSRGR